MSERVITSEAVLEPDAGQAKFLRAYGDAYGLAVREVYRRCVIGDELWFVKGEPGVRSELIARGWSQREATSVHKNAQAAQKAAVESTKLALTQAQEDLAAVAGKLKKAPVARRHGLARRRDILICRVQRLTSRLADDAVRVCFGSRRVLRATREWEANGFACQADARAAWRRRRAGMVYCEGEKEEIGGNASLRVALDEAGDSVSIRVPAFLRALTDGQERVVIRARGFAVKQGRDALAATLVRESRRFEWQAACAIREQQYRQWVAGGRVGAPPKTPRKNAPKPTCGSPVSVRLSWNEKAQSWYAAASFTVDCDTRAGSWAGLLGVDINPGHLAWALINRHGNPIAKGRISLQLDGSTAQVNDNIGVAVKELFQIRDLHAWELNGPVVVVRERLDFARARQGLRYLPRRLSKLLSSFAYRRIMATIDSRAHRDGVSVREVNPAWTSVLGQANYAATLGFSVDQAAAVVIARRGLGLRTRLRPSVQGRLTQQLLEEKMTSGAPSRARDSRVTHPQLLREAGKRLGTPRHATYRDDGLARRASARVDCRASVSSAPHPRTRGQALPDAISNRADDATMASREAMVNRLIFIAADAPPALQLSTSD